MQRFQVQPPAGILKPGRGDETDPLPLYGILYMPGLNTSTVKQLPKHEIAKMIGIRCPCTLLAQVRAGPPDMSLIDFFLIIVRSFLFFIGFYFIMMDFICFIYFIYLLSIESS